jgi:fucose 4-O-acetylase-like acetyltransferase
VFHIPAFLVVAGFLYQRPYAISLRDIGARLKHIGIPYLIASCIAQLAGFTTAQSWRDVIYQLLTVSSVGIYYFIGILAVCTLSVWLLSRVTLARLAGLLVVLFAISCVFEVYGSRLYLTSVVG